LVYQFDRGYDVLQFRDPTVDGMPLIHGKDFDDDVLQRGRRGDWDFFEGVRLSFGDAKRIIPTAFPSDEKSGTFAVRLPSARQLVIHFYTRFPEQSLTRPRYIEFRLINPRLYAASGLIEELSQ
jgi:hypothetical protein